jgi:hypothetical protein
MPTSTPDRRPSDPTSADSTRRQFLKGAALAGTGWALGATGAEAGPPPAPAEEKAAATLPAIGLGPHALSRLILGGNPIYGYSHFNRLYDQHLRSYHTPERVVELVGAATAAGINTWQNSYDPRTLADVERCRAAGHRFQWLLLGKPDWDAHPEIIDEVARRKPIGIAPHGSLAERLHRAGKLPALLELLKRIRGAGVLVGLSAHNPRLIEIAEEGGWDVDYYMCCLYYLTRPRDELRKILGEVPLGEIYLPGDRERMLRVVAGAKKPCLVYKVLAAGRQDLSPGGIRRAFEETLKAIKPTDGMIVGMFQEFGDQVAGNAALVRELSGSAGRS